MPRERHGEDGSCRIVFCVPDPGHAVAADFCGNPADFGEQLLFIGRADQRLITAAQHSLRAVQAHQIALRLQSMRHVLREYQRGLPAVKHNSF